jgi:nucleoside-diphosphate-sugar epimerase
MSIAQVALSPAALIVGCGFVGRLLAAKLVARGVRAFALVRSQASANMVAQLGAHPLLADVTEPPALAAALAPALERPLDVYYLVPPGRPKAADENQVVRTVIDGPRNLLSLLGRAAVRRIVAASSTAVYGQSDGEQVDADTPALPGDERGRLLLDGESIWRHSGFAAHIVRFAGLYGPGRIIGMQAVHGGAPLVGDPEAWLNLIHGDDAADLMLAVMSCQEPGEIELGSDGWPVRRVEYYNDLAKFLGAPPPRVLDPAAASAQLGVERERLRRASSKRCDNVRTCQRTGWLPQYPHYRDGLRASFAAMRR